MDYKETGLKCGLEIHQQLSGHKLFCECPCFVRQDAPDFRIKRELRALAGETGEIDIAALHERKKGKYFVYEFYKNTNCLVELDEEPPHPINPEALKVALTVAKILHCEFPDKIQVMRKTVVDGSNTSGFQRTSLIGANGFLETGFGRVGIQTVCLEEDAARKISDDENSATYRLDRLGIPMIEIATAPDVQTPEQARELAESLGLLLRSTGKVMRGLGTIRQDVNISITGGNRVEIKGCQDLKGIPILVENEIKRQQMLIDVKKELKARSVEAVKASKVFDLSEIFKATSSKVISGNPIFGIRLEKFSGLLKNKLGPEMAKYARFAAGVKGIFHSDELPAYGITLVEVDKVKEVLQLKDKDAFVLVSASREAAEKALAAVVERAETALREIPKEVRNAREDNSTEYLRPMPGSARMYPETDLPLIEVPKKLIDELELPETFEEKKKKFLKLGLSEDLASQLIRNPDVFYLEALLNKFRNIKPNVLASIFLSAEQEVKRKTGKAYVFSDAEYEAAFDLLDKDKVTKEASLDIFCGLASQECILELEKKFRKLSDDELKEEIKKIIKENLSAPKEKLQGLILGRLRGKAEVEKILEMLIKLTK